ncbi:PREDICTED: upstream activation factor subunit spp27 [Nelumbo nucifera]|uniref:DM2 domain-containing protein n=2 Tax=Nelumbo nucifera TaxID=4432 RepID=A0A822Y614_NELNU|nr:PREDICTED: upstream activation factor subunit spp27 [Nelumbo nucifera]DAD25038.1 TPA_asm: hypothetical protein HUJ06_026502 [Nelumbo nucifera]
MASRVFRGCRVLMAAANKSSTGAKASAASTSSSRTTASAKAQTGIFKVVPVSPALRKFIGAPEVSRGDAVKKVWEYIKENNLQNPANKKEIRCDDKLKSIFEGKDTVGFLEIATLLSRHFVKTN